MKDSRKWDEKLSIWVGIVAGLFTISGISILGIFNSCSSKEFEKNTYVEESVDETKDVLSENSNFDDSFDEDNKENEYKNEVRIYLEVASVLCEDINGTYVPIDTENIEINSSMDCTMSNDKNTYISEVKGDYFYFKDIEPGEYIACFKDNANKYKSSEISVIISEARVSSTICTQYKDIFDYEDYIIRYDVYVNEQYMFMNDEGDKVIAENIFTADENGEFYFRVDWILNPKVHIHSVDGEHMNILLDEKYNGARFIN